MRSWRFRQGRLTIIILAVIIFLLVNTLIFVIVENSKVCFRLPCNDCVCEEKECPTCEECEMIECPTCEECKVCNESSNLITGNVVKELVCDKPYIRNDYGCCLDNNDNNICDEDEFLVNNTPKQTMKSKLKDTAEFYAKNFINESYDEIYSLLTDNAKDMMSESDFEDLFPAVIYGVRCSIVGDDDYSCKILEQPYKTMFVDMVEIKDFNGTINYSTRNQEDLMNFSTEFFVYEEEEWKITSINYLPYAGCEDVSDCSDKDDFLNPICFDVCTHYRFMEFKKDKPFSCEKNVCHCGCWSEINQFSTYRRPSNKIINEYSLK